MRLLAPLRFCGKCLSIFFEFDAYCVFVIIILIGILAHFGGIYDIALFEQTFPGDFSWPPHVFEHNSYRSYQKTPDNRRIDYFEFTSSLSSSLEEWKLNSAFWRLENQDAVDRPSFAPGMMGLVSHIPLIRDHIQYLKAITTRVSGMPLPAACSREYDRAGIRRIGLIILVKSAVTHTAQRDAIRKSWAANSFHRKLRMNQSVSRGLLHQVMFLVGLEGGLGVSSSPEFSYNHQADLMEEQHDHQDLIQMQFIDTYFNNTAKSVSALHFLIDHCPILDTRHGFVFLTDDDMFINMRNLEKLVEETKKERDSQSIPKDVYLGYRFPGSKPKRWRWSKWYVSTEEYPFSWYPPYVTAAGILLSKDTAEKFFYASHFVPLFRFDDIYFAILAHVLGIESQHKGDAFFFHHLPFEGSQDLYRDSVIAVHGYHEASNLLGTFAKLQALYQKVGM